MAMLVHQREILSCLSECPHLFWKIGSIGDGLLLDLPDDTTLVRETNHFNMNLSVLPMRIFRFMCISRGGYTTNTDNSPWHQLSPQQKAWHIQNQIHQDMDRKPNKSLNQYPYLSRSNPISVPCIQYPLVVKRG